MIEIICKECKQNVIVEDRRFKMCLVCSKNKQLERCRQYKQKNKEKISEYNKDYKQKNKEKVCDYNKKYNVENRAKIQKRQTEQKKERRKTDTQYKLSIVLRNRFRKFYKGKSSSIKDLIGCSYKNFLKWMEFNFTGDMSWENHGTLWHIDHVLLCHMFDHNNIDDRKICFNWKNTRPLLAIKNLSRKTIEMKDLLNHEIALTYFTKQNKEGYNDIEVNFAYLTTKLLEKSNNGSS